MGLDGLTSPHFVSNRLDLTLPRTLSIVRPVVRSSTAFLSFSLGPALFPPLCFFLSLADASGATMTALQRVVRPSISRGNFVGNPSRIVPRCLS